MDLFVFAGETSGDVHGAAILKQLRAINPNIKISGVAGPRMRKLGLDLFMPMEDFQVMGYVDVFKNIGKLLLMFKKTQKHILKHQPKAVLFIDYPGFNLRMAKALRKRKFNNKLIHYICPTVWAHGKKRVFTLAKTLDLLLSIFPFEQEYFTATNLTPTYVGHPLIEESLSHDKVDNWREKYKIDPKTKLIGIFPGSRNQEIKQNLPKILKSCELFKAQNPDYKYVLSVADQKLKFHIDQEISHSSLKMNKDIYLIPSFDNFQIMHHIHSAIAVSGTINFELGVMKVPTVVVYHLSKVNAWIAKNWMKLDLTYYCIVNIITKKHIFPELYHTNFIPQKVASNLDEICKDGHLRQNSLKGCDEMLSIMDCKKCPSELAAQEIHSLIHV